MVSWCVYALEIELGGFDRDGGRARNGHCMVNASSSRSHMEFGRDRRFAVELHMADRASHAEQGVEGSRTVDKCKADRMPWLPRCAHREPLA